MDKRSSLLKGLISCNVVSHVLSEIKAPFLNMSLISNPIQKTDDQTLFTLKFFSHV